MAHILRGNEVEIEGQYNLGVGAVGTRAPEGGQNDTDTRVRVVEDGPQHTVLEVTCACGQTSYIRCEH